MNTEATLVPASFNWLDLALLGMLISSLVSGFIRGFSRTIIGFAASVIAILAAIWFYPAAAALLKPYVAHPSLANFAGFGLIFAGVTIAGAISSRILERMIKWAGLKWLDRLMGAGVGAVRAGVVAAAIVMGLCAFSRNPPPSAVAQSQLAPYALELANVLTALAPAELRKGFDESYAKVKKLWQDVLKKVPDRV